MKIFIDFDDVLFNTKKFKDDYFSVFKKRGVPRDVFDESYFDHSDNEIVKKYDPEKHIARICAAVKIESADFESDIAAFIVDTSRYVFSDVEAVLDKFEKADLHILSFSMTNFQKAKISGSGIAHFFSKIRITDELKGAAISEMIDEEKQAGKTDIYFIDDRAEQIKSVKLACSQVRTVLCSRREGRYRDRKSKYCDHKITRLEEVEAIIKINSKNGK